MKIHYVSRGDSSAIPFRLSEVLGEDFSYSCVGGTRFGIPSGLEHGSEDQNLALEDSDVVILSGDAGEELAKGKPFGRYFSCPPEEWIEQPDPERSAISPQKNWRKAKYARVLPLPVDLESPNFSPEEKKPVVLYTPSNTTIRDTWSNKGYEETNKQLRKADEERGIEYKIVSATDQDYLSLLSARRRSSLVIDECMTGSYNNTSIEALAAGCCVISNSDIETEEAFGIMYNSDKIMLPTMKCPWTSISGIIRSLMENPDFLKYKMQGDREWMQKHYSKNWQREKWMNWANSLV